MNLNLTDTQRRHMAKVNLNAAFDHLDYLLDHPEAIAEIPNGSTIQTPVAESGLCKPINEAEFAQLVVATCNHRGADLQSSHFRPGLFATINKSRPGLNENEPAIIAFRPAIIRLNRDYLQL